MLRCPRCGGKTKVKETATRPKAGRLLATVLIDWPTACYRLRHCLQCPWRGGSVELAFPDLVVLLTDTGKAFMHAHRSGHAHEQAPAPQG